MDIKREAAVCDTVAQLMAQFPLADSATPKERNDQLNLWREKLKEKFSNSEELGRGERILKEFERQAIRQPVSEKDSFGPEVLRPCTQFGAPSSFELKERLGDGFTSSIYRCLDRRSLHFYALKMVEKLDSNTREPRAMVEAQNLLRLQHRNIVGIYGAGTVFRNQREVPYLAMELLEGRTVHQWVNEDHPDVSSAVFVMALIADALAYCHEHGITHGDPSSKNIMLIGTLLTRDSVKLIDFGNSEQHGRPPETSVWKRSPFEHEAWEKACREDLRRLGMTLYFAITKHELPPAFAQEADSTRVQRTWERISDLQLRTVLTTLFDRKTDRGYHSAKDLAHDLALWLNSYRLNEADGNESLWTRFQLLANRCRTQNRPDDHATMLGVLFSILGPYIFLSN